MSLLIIPALIALLIKIAVLFAAAASQKTQYALEGGERVAGESEAQRPLKTKSKGVIGIFTTMVLIMSGHNLAEVLGYVEFIKGTFQDDLLRWYYLMTVASLAMMVIYAKKISGLHAQKALLSKSITVIVVATTVCLGALFMFSDFLISGAYSIGYSMTADRGQGYWLFLLFSLACFVSIYGYLIVGYIRANSHLTEIQCGYTLWALMPIMATSIVLIVLMKLGLQVNAALVMPFATAAFLVITLKSEKVHGMFDIRRHIPLSLERRTSAEIMDIFSSYSQDQLNYRDAMNEIEKLLVTHKHQKNGGNVSTTAASMELPRSSLYSIFRRLDIDLKDDKR